MSRWPRGEAITPHVLGLVATDTVVYHDGSIVDESAEARDCILTDQAEVRIATSEKVWSWFADQVLQTLGHHEGASKRETQAHPTGIPFPQFATPPQYRRGPFGGRTSRHEH